MSIFKNIDSIVLNIMSEDDTATYNDVEAKVIIDRDVEVESEGGVFARMTTATVDSVAVSESVRGDQIFCEGEYFTVQSIQSDDGGIRVLEVRKA